MFLALIRQLARLWFQLFVSELRSLAEGFTDLSAENAGAVHCTEDTVISVCSFNLAHFRFHEFPMQNARTFPLLHIRLTVLTSPPFSFSIKWHLLGYLGDSPYCFSTSSLLISGIHVNHCCTSSKGL